MEAENHAGNCRVLNDRRRIVRALDVIFEREKHTGGDDYSEGFLVGLNEAIRIANRGGIDDGDA